MKHTTLLTAYSIIYTSNLFSHTKAWSIKYIKPLIKKCIKNILLIKWVSQFTNTKYTNVLILIQLEICKHLLRVWEYFGKLTNDRSKLTTQTITISNKQNKLYTRLMQHVLYLLHRSKPIPKSLEDCVLALLSSNLKIKVPQNYKIWYRLFTKHVLSRLKYHSQRRSERISKLLKWEMSKYFYLCLQQKKLENQLRLLHQYNNLHQS